MGFDDIQVLHMGGVLKRVEFFVCGRALQQALGCLRATRAANQMQKNSQKSIACTTGIWELIKEDFSGPEDQKSKIEINIPGRTPKTQQ